MTEKQLRQRMADAAAAWLGLHESDGSHRAVLEVYNAIRPLPRGYAMRDTDPWCAAFVSAVGAKCGLTEIVFPECSCPRMAALYRAAGRWEEVDFAVPKPGDLVFYDWDGDRVSDHVGLVAAAEGDYLTVVEGNKSDAVGKRRLRLDNRNILGYGQPDYFHYADTLESAGAGAPDGPQPAESAGAGAPDGPQPAESAGAGALDGPQTADSAGAGAPDGPQTAVSLVLPLLAMGARGESVRAAQLLLAGRGFGCGKSGADGDFGPATREAVLRCQRARGLAVDGEIGPETWACLLGVSA